MSAMPVPRIELRTYLGKTGSFGPDQTVHKAMMIGVDGKEWDVDWQSGGYGNSDIKYAERDAMAYRVKTGWPIVRLIERRDTSITWEAAPREQ